ncbi:MAG: hypothetical protein PWP23_874 [Candidatus Sumerlaeota bacterium]|nr:hypothetical protein [Candidatus Sumerlaeota bacterium]
MPFRFFRLLRSSDPAPSTTLACALFLLIAALSPAAPLDREVEQIIAGGASGRALWGVYAADVKSGEVIADLNEDKLFVPASNRKLVATAMALKYIGASKVLETTVEAATKPSGGRIAGDLVVRAVGDPSWTASLQNGRTGASVLRSVARSLKEQGITSISGDVVVDASRYREPTPMPEGWEWSDFQTSDGALPSVFGIDRNLASVLIEPGSPGEAVKIAFDSRTEAFTIINNAVTGRRDSAPTFQIARGLDGTRLVATGSLASNTPVGRRAMPLGRPAEFAAREFAAILQAEGISVSGEARVTTSSVPKGDVLATIRSATIAEIATRANEDSDNFLAESLYLLAGAELYGRGSYTASLEAERRFWRDAGVETTAWVGADGSGLSRRNLVSPKAFAALLTTMHDNEAFRESLAVSGRSGTLHYRLSGNGMAGRVRAKTGTLTGVAALSGYVTTNSGKTIVFSILVNNFSSSPSPIRADIDRIVEALARR